MRTMGFLFGAGAVLVLVAVLAGTGCFRYYRWESKKENPGQADVLIVLGLKLDENGRGSFILHNRVAMARYLMDRGYAPRLLVSGGNPRQGITEASKMTSIAVDLGVPQDKITAEHRARTTVENARYSAELMAAFGWRSALVVTDAAHLGYALPVFRDAFEPRGFELYWLPVDYGLLDRLGIGKHPSDPPR